MKFTSYRLPLCLFPAALCLLGAAALAQSNALQDKPFQPSPSVIKGTVAALSDGNQEVVALAARSLGDWKTASAAADVAKLLGSDSPAAVRMEALQYFARLGEQAKANAAEVAKQAKDGDPNIRRAVLEALFQANASSANVDIIRSLLEDPRADVRASAARCLGQAGPSDENRKALLNALAKTGSGDFRAAALQALARIGGLSVADIDAILPLMQDQEAEVRIAAWNVVHSGIVAAKAAGKLPEEKDKAVREALIAQFSGEPEEIKTAIINETGKDKATVEASVGILVNRIRTGSPEIKAAALRVLGKAGDAADGQIQLIADEAKNPDFTVRAAAIAALGSLGPTAVKANIPAIAKGLLDESDLVRDEALLALPAGGEALRNFPFRVRDVYPGASPGVRATLVKALPIVVGVLGMDDDALARARAALADPSPDLRIAIAYVVAQLGAKNGSALLPDLLALLKAPEASVRGAAAISLRSFAADAANREKLRAALRPLLKDPDAEVRWAVLDTFHELDPGQEAADLAGIAALVKDEDQMVRLAAVRALGAGGASAKPHLLEIIRAFNDDPAVPPYTAAQALLEIGPLSPQELTSALNPLYVYADLLPLTRLTAYGASGGDSDGVLLLRLLGRSRTPARELIKADQKARAIELLQGALKAPLLNDQLKSEIEARLGEVRA